MCRCAIVYYKVPASEGRRQLGLCRPPTASETLRRFIHISQPVTTVFINATGRRSCARLVGTQTVAYASSSGSPASSPPIQPTDTHMWRTFVVYTREPAKSQFMRTEAGFHAARRKATCDEHVVMRSPVGCSSSREVGRQQTGSIT